MVRAFEVGRGNAMHQGMRAGEWDVFIFEEVAALKVLEATGVGTGRPAYSARKTAMKIYTLYVGSNGNGQPTREELVEMVGGRFESFTLLPGQGVFRGMAEPVWLVQLAGDDVERVLAMAEHLRAHFDQDGVGVEHAGNYFRCTAADRASGLRQLLVNER